MTNVCPSVRPSVLDVRPSPSRRGTRGVWASDRVALYSVFLGVVLGLLGPLAEYRTVLQVLEIVQSPVAAEYRTVLAVLESALFWV